MRTVNGGVGQAVGSCCSTIRGRRDTIHAKHSRDSARKAATIGEVANMYGFVTVCATTF